jgi:hypothetical protein
MERTSTRSTIVTLAILLAVFLFQLGVGWWLFPAHGKPKVDSANHFWWVVLLVGWVADWIALFNSQSISFGNEWRFLGSMALGFAAAFVGWWAYMVIG